MTKIDFSNKSQIAYIIIYLFVIVSLIILYNMKETMTENFEVLREDQSLGSNKVLMDTTDNVYFGTLGNQKSLTSKMNDINTSWQNAIAKTIEDLNTIIDKKLQIDKDKILTVDATIKASGAINCVGLNSIGGGSLGGTLAIFNTEKTGSTEAYHWTLYNSRAYGGIGGTGKPGSGLSFWRYCKEGCGKGLCNQHMTLNDDGSTFFAGNIEVGGELGTSSTIRKTRGNGANMHITSDKNLYLMAKENIIVFKNPEPFWDNSSGNMSIEGQLYVAGLNNHVSAKFADLESRIASLETKVRSLEEKQFGDNQKWYNVKNDRAANYDYKNDSKRPWLVCYTGWLANSSANMRFTVDGVNVAMGWIGYNIGYQCNACFVVPAGSTYRLISDYLETSYWAELK